MLKKLAFLFLILVMLGTLAVVYVNNFFFPVKLKGIVTERAEQFLERKVSIGNIQFHLLKGFVISDITVQSKENPDENCLQIKHIYFSIAYLPLIQSSNIIIPSVAIEEPILSIKRLPAGQWNFSDVLVRDPSSSKAQIFLGKIAVINGTLNYEDAAMDQPLRETFTRINAKAALSLTKGSTFSVETSLADEQGFASAKGTYDFKTETLSGELNLNNIPMNRYTVLMPFTQPYTLSSGTLRNALVRFIQNPKSLTTQGDVAVQDIHVHSPDLEFQGNLTTQNLTTRSKDGNLLVQGQMQLTGVNLRTKAGHYTSDKITLQELIATYKDNRFATKVNIIGSNVVAEVSANRTFRGTLNTFATQMVWTPETLSVQTPVILSNIDTTYDTFAFKGDGRIGALTLNKNADGVRADLADITLNNASLTDAHRSLNGQITSAKTSMSFSDPQFELTTTLQLNQGRVNYDGITFTGNPEIRLRMFTDAAKNAHCQGNLRLSEASLSGLPYIQSLDKVTGDIGFSDDNIKLSQLNLTALNTTLLLNGSIKGIKDPLLDLRIQSNQVDLSLLNSLLSVWDPASSWSLSGTTSMDVLYNGPLRDPLTHITAAFGLNNAAVSSSKLPSALTNLTGTFMFGQEQIAARNMQGIWDSQPFTLTGEFNRTDPGTADFQLSSPILNVTSKAKVMKDRITFATFSGNYYNSNFKLQGDVFLNGPTPQADMLGDIELNAEDLVRIVPDLGKSLSRLQLKGILHWHGMFKGALNDWRNWALTCTLTSPSIAVQNHTLNELEINYAQRDRKVSRLDIAGLLYNGKLFISSTMDLKDDTFPFTSLLTLEGLDLAKLRSDLKIKKQLSGSLSSEFNVVGNLNDNTTFNGTGTLSIKDGHIWELNLFKGLTQLLLIPELESTVFTEANGTFKIENGKILSNNVFLKSTLVTLRGKGWIDFNGMMDFQVRPEFSGIAIAKSPSLRKGPTSLIAQSTGHVFAIDIKGPVTKPEFKKNFGVLRATTEILKGGIKGIFNEVF